MPLNLSAPSLQCKWRQERGRELGAHKDPKGLFSQLLWWSLDTERRSSELASTKTHEHAGRVARPFNPKGPWADMLAPGAGAPLGGDIVIRRWRREMDRLGGPTGRAGSLSYVTFTTIYIKLRFQRL